MNLSNLILQFNFYFIAFAAYINRTGVAARLGISTAQKTDMNDKAVTFNDNLLLYAAPDTHNSGSVNDMNVSYAECYALVEAFKKQIKANTSVVLTGADRINLGMPEDKPHRSRVPVPTITPAVLCVKISPLAMKFIAFDTTNPFKKGKPTDVGSVGVKMAIVGVGAPPPIETDYIKLDPVKQTEFELLFTAGQAGKMVYVICYYLNPRGEAGPESLPCSVKII